MLRILEIVIASFCIVFSIYFGALSALSVFKYFINYQSLDTYEKIRGAKTRTIHQSLSAAGFMVALSIILRDLIGLILLPFILGVIWLAYIIYKATIMVLDKPWR